MKECMQCHREKRLEEYHKAKLGAKGRVAKCKTCVATNARKYNKTDQTRNKVFEVSGIRYKKCNECFVAKEVGQFYPHGNSYVSKCKECYSSLRRTGTGPKPIDTVKVGGVEHKECRKCEQVKPLAEYPKSEKGIGRRRSRCTECEKVTWAKYREKNKQATREASRRWRLKNPEKQRIASRKWRIRNPERNILYINTRKARLNSLRNCLTPSEWDEILDDFGRTCALSPESEGITMDHFVPVSFKGGTYKGNVYPLSSFLNNSKHNRNPFDWYEEYGISHGVAEDKWESLLEYLASQNKMNVTEFKQHVQKTFSKEVSGCE